MPVGTNGTGSASIQASNAGDCNLNLSHSASTAWLVLATGTGTLAAGLYTGVITLFDPKAVDAPQTVTVTVSVGGSFRFKRQ